MHHPGDDTGRRTFSVTYQFNLPRNSSYPHHDLMLSIGLDLIHGLGGRKDLQEHPTLIGLRAGQHKPGRKPPARCAPDADARPKKNWLCEAQHPYSANPRQLRVLPPPLERVHSIGVESATQTSSVLRSTSRTRVVLTQFMVELSPRKRLLPPCLPGRCGNLSAKNVAAHDVSGELLKRNPAWPVSRTA